jgi:hypothetical protein
VVIVRTMIFSVICWISLAIISLADWHVGATDEMAQLADRSPIRVI